jgi:anhydro-N-acetylmuramic acid kinase
MIEKLSHIMSKSKKLAVGLMSGTSLDGIDAALVEIEHAGIETKVNLVSFCTLAYNEEERLGLLELCSPESSPVDKVCAMNVYLGHKFAEASRAVVESAGRTLKEVDFISSHGQTIYHMPDHGATMQIGELAVIADATGCLTVGDYRPSDMAAGGQGAPLVPYADHLLFHSLDIGRVVMNIGGISNVTILKSGAQSHEITAFDTGPGNLLIDAIVSIGSDGALHYDRDGKIAASGKVNEDWLSELLCRDAFILKKPPKSTGREQYSMEFAWDLWAQGNDLQLSFEDITATITAYTSHSIAANFDKHIDSAANITEVIVGGGGTRNPVLMANLRSLLKRNVVSSDEYGIPSDAKEAVSFVVLGNEFLHGNTNNLPSATGASRAVVMGKLALPGGV